MDKYRENKRRKPVLNLTIQLAVVYLYTKYEHSSLNGCGDIFDEKVLRNYGRTDGRMEWRTEINQYTPTHFSKRGIITALQTDRIRFYPAFSKRGYNNACNDE